MPYKSDKQRRFFHWAQGQGKIPASTVHEWDEASKGKDLPETAKKASLLDAVGGRLVKAKYFPKREEGSSYAKDMAAYQQAQQLSHDYGNKQSGLRLELLQKFSAQLLKPKTVGAFSGMAGPAFLTPPGKDLAQAAFNPRRTMKNAITSYAK